MTPASPSILAELKEHCPRGLHSAIPFPGVDVPSLQKVPNVPHLETAFGLHLPPQKPGVGDGVKVCLGLHWRGKWHRNPELRNLVGKAAPVLHHRPSWLFRKGATSQTKVSDWAVYCLLASMGMCFPEAPRVPEFNVCDQGQSS